MKNKKRQPKCIEVTLGRRVAGGSDVHQDTGNIVVWRWFLFRYWARTVPLMVPSINTQEVDLGPATGDQVGTRKATTLYFGDVAMKDVKRKHLGRFMAELRWLVHEGQFSE